MRKACLRLIPLLAALVGCMALSSRATAQPQILVDFTSTWKYNDSTTLPADWMTNSFSDASWPSGPGLLGFETTPAAYPVAFGTALVPTDMGGPTTYYFRTAFNFTGSTNGATLTLSNLVDDGCVIFLNGVESGRLRVPAAQTATTFASGGPATEGAIEVLTLPVGRLRQGPNLLAVEVHQVGPATSSDVAWGGKLVVVVPATVAITNQPVSQTISLGSPVTFSVGISGGPARYQWQKSPASANNWANISATATNSSYSIGSVVAGDAGDYRVIVTGSLNSVTSAPATLTVVSDLVGPKLISAVVREVVQTVGTNVITNFNQVDVTFDEQLTMTTATNIANYQVVRWEGRALVPIVSAQYSFPVVRLTVNTNVAGVWLYRSNYFVCVTNVADARGNLIDPDSCIGVSWRVTTNVMQMNGVWKYYDSAFISTTPFDNQQWKNTNYVPGTDWGDGFGIFSFGIDVGTFCAGDGPGTAPTYLQEPTLYRSTFNIATNSSRTGTLRMRHFIDDGAVFYLNGVEIYRFGVAGPGTAVTANTRAAGNVTAACLTNDVNVSNLNPGQNLIAVAACDGPAVDSETAFGVEIDNISLQTGPAPPPRAVLPPPRFTSITRSGNNITMTWTNTSAILLTSTNVAATGANWTQVAGAATPYTTQATGPARFYRLRNP